MAQALTTAISGMGFESSDEQTKSFIDNNLEKEYGTDFLSQIASDLAHFSSFAINIVYSRDRTKIARVYHVPVDTVRVDKNQNGYWISSDWVNYSRAGVVHYPKFDPTKPEEGSQILYAKLNNQYSKIYSVPSWMSAANWIALESELSKVYLSNVCNTALSSVAFTIPGNPNDEEKEQIHKKFSEQFQGAENAGRFLLLFSDPDAEVQPVVTPIPSGIEADLFTHYVEEARQQIITAHNATSPVLASLQRSGTLGGDGAEIEQAWQMYNKQVASKYHRLITDVLKDILQFNGLDTDLTIKKYTTTDAD